LPLFYCKVGSRQGGVALSVQKKTRKVRVIAAIAIVLFSPTFNHLVAEGCRDLPD